MEPRLNRLTRGDTSIQIELKMMDVLVCLAERAGELVTRQEIFDTVWAVEFITEKTLTRAIAELRRTLGDDAKQPSYIETIHRKGYRLIAPVKMGPESSSKIAHFPVRATGPSRNPYPGLAAFTEAEAEFFFGREAEVVSMWRTIISRRLLALIGPSGVGKSSFLRAGLIPAAPNGWGVLYCQPGEAPFAALPRALSSRFEGGPEAASELAEIEDPFKAVALVSRWRARHERCLLIVDQFEELFTLNTPEVQTRFAEVIGALARNADVHVVLSIRDDFLYRCHEHDELLPVFTELTPLKVPAREDLHRALIQPAAGLGFSFEDSSLVDEMVEAVSGERGALPLLAFAVARVWEKRDCEHRLMTRQAYADIGGVAGALSQHAEATIGRIGSQHIRVMRELFRNLLTADGTRAVREWDELLSVFSDPHGESPEAVLRALIDARLLTSYEIHQEDRGPTRHVEIIHESLLDNWPRLVGWRTQDADSARLRDELRQAARTWQERDRSDDLLWTGSVYREFRLWRERYPGGLSETEEAFGEAMAGFSKRRKRRRRFLRTTAIVVLLAVLAVVGSFWRRSVIEARRAEAANLFALGQLQLEEHPTAAIAYAIASLELADSPEVRRLAVDALWRGPTEFRFSASSPFALDFSPDGSFLATADPDGGGRLWPSDGGPPTVLEGNDFAMEIRFSPGGDLVAANIGKKRQEIGVWSASDGRLLRRLDLGGAGVTHFFRFSPDSKRLITSTDPIPMGLFMREIRSWPIVGGKPDLVARLPMPQSSGYVFAEVDPTMSYVGWADGRTVRVASLTGSNLDLASVRSVPHDRAIAAQIFDRTGRLLATSDSAGTIRIWSLESDQPELIHTLQGYGGISSSVVLFDPSSSMLAAMGGLLWDHTAPPDAEPLRLGPLMDFDFALAFDPLSRWLATSGSGSVSLWPLHRPHSVVLRGHQSAVNNLAFTPDGTHLVSTSEDGSVRVWPLDGNSGKRTRILHQIEGVFSAPTRLAVAPDGSFVTIGNPVSQVTVLPLDGDPPRQLSGFSDTIASLAVGPMARFVAAGSGDYNLGEAVTRVWDLETGAVRVLDAGDGEAIYGLRFARNGDIWVASGNRLRRWRLDGNSASVQVERVLSAPDGTEVRFFDLSSDERVLLLGAEDGRLWTQDLVTGETRELRSHAGRSGWASFDPTGDVVISTDIYGTRLGTVTGEETHLLLGPQRGVYCGAVSSDGKWIATGSGDSAIRLWPMPDLSRPPLHTLPHDELIAKLKTLTNLRVVRDQESSTGWKVVVGPFPGWEVVPEW